MERQCVFRHAMGYATQSFFHNHGFVSVHTPIITGADCEGAGGQFGVTTILGSGHLVAGVTFPCTKLLLQKKKNSCRKESRNSWWPKGTPTSRRKRKILELWIMGRTFWAIVSTLSGQHNVETRACALRLKQQKGEILLKK